MKKTRHSLFAFSPYLYKGVEEYLNEQAAQGWELVKVGTVFAKFRRTERTNLRYCADLLTYRRRDEGRERQREYLALCREGGWELVDRRGAMGLFASRPGIDPAPIQTDPDTERYCYKRAYRNSLFWTAATMLPMVFLWAIMFFISGVNQTAESLARAWSFQWPRSWVMGTLRVGLPVLLAVGVWKLAEFLWNWLHTRRAGWGQAPGRRAMWVNATSYLLVVVAVVPMFVGGLLGNLQSSGSASYFIGIVLGGLIVFACSFFYYVDELYPREFRRMRVYGASAAVLGIVMTALLWTGTGKDTVRFWPESDDFISRCAEVEALPVVRGQDFGMEPEGTYTLSRGTGPVGKYTILRQGSGGELGGISCSRYDCWFDALAAQTARALAEEAEQPEYRTYKGRKLWGDYSGADMEAVALSWADEAWLGGWTDDSQAKDGESKRGQVLVLRKGSTAVRVFAPFALDGAETLETIRARLGF